MAESTPPEGGTAQMPPRKEPNQVVRDALTQMDRTMDRSYEAALGKITPQQRNEGTFGWKDMRNVTTSDERIERMEEAIRKYREFGEKIEESERFIPQDNINWYKREIVRHLIVRGDVNTPALNQAIIDATGTINKGRFTEASTVMSTSLIFGSGKPAK